MEYKKGDIFEFSINQSTKSYGQIIDTAKKSTITIIVFEGLYSSRPEIKELLNDNILFFGNTFDGKLFNKHWIVFDNFIDNIKNVKLPYYKIGLEDLYVEDFFENKLRKINKNEEDVLLYKSYIAPVRFELALKAYYKILTWDNDYDKLLYSNVLKSNEIIEHR
ncbi:hypothetical protein AMR72_17575 [Flavobacterium psychrophilum]|nr:hypothetical protein AMR72_17575 [Flavobacterium psychrophilum]AOE54153.1 hypothetical protein ALW18_17560 [Flavobacterium psychrophilum]